MLAAVLVTTFAGIFGGDAQIELLATAPAAQGLRYFGEEGVVQLALLLPMLHLTVGLKP